MSQFKLNNKSYSNIPHPEFQNRHILNVQRQKNSKKNSEVNNTDAQRSTTLGLQATVTACHELRVKKRSCPAQLGQCSLFCTCYV